MNHPAVYSNALLPLFAGLLNGYREVLDPCAGTGKLAALKSYGFRGKVICNELEKEWAGSEFPVDEWHIGDAVNMGWLPNESIEAICTSPTYGNRMADHHNAKDGTRRITYKHYLGHDLHEANTGAMQWGDSYRQKHLGIYRECFRVLEPGGIMVVNISDHIRDGKRVHVSEWHQKALTSIGFTIERVMEVKTPRMGFGQNREARVQHEEVIISYKPLTGEEMPE